jgi:hypothetical protein
MIGLSDTSKCMICCPTRAEMKACTGCCGQPTRSDFARLNFRIARYGGVSAINEHKPTFRYKSGLHECIGDDALIESPCGPHNSCFREHKIRELDGIGSDDAAMGTVAR